MTNQERRDRIENEIIVDAYDDGEIHMSWFYYFNDYLELPISAVAKLKRRNGKYENADIQIVEIASDTEQELMLGFVLTMQGFVFPISLKDIVSVDTSDENREMLNDWLFWKGLRLLS